MSQSTNDPQVYCEQLRALMPVISAPSQFNPLPDWVKESLLFLASDLSDRIDSALTNTEGTPA